MDPFYDISRTPDSTVWVQRSLSLLKRKDLCLCTYSLVLHLDIDVFLLHRCGSFGVEHVNWVLGRKQGLKMQFLYLAAIRMNWIILRSLLFVVCGHICFYVLCEVLQLRFFCWMWKRSDFFFFLFLNYTAYHQSWRPLSTKCSNTCCRYQKGPKHCWTMDCLDNPLNSFQLRSG